MWQVFHKDKLVILTNSPTLLLSYLRSMLVAYGYDMSEIDADLLDSMLSTDMLDTLDVEVYYNEKN